MWYSTLIGDAKRMRRLSVNKETKQKVYVKRKIPNKPLENVAKLKYLVDL
jgi:hypothetical protein